MVIDNVNQQIITQYLSIYYLYI